MPEHLQRDRERDHCRSSVAGGETTRRQGAGMDFSPEVAERERETAAAGVDFSPEVAWFSRRGGSGGGAKWRRSSARWWPELQREMEERNCRESCAREEERGCSIEP